MEITAPQSNININSSLCGIINETHSLIWLPAHGIDERAFGRKAESSFIFHNSRARRAGAQGSRKWEFWSSKGVASSSL